jgi:hypothetical protein
MKHFKTLLLLTGMLCIGLTAWAQPSKGSAMIGGNAGFNSYSYGDFSSSYIYLGPRVGYFFTDMFEAGAAVDLNFYGGDDEGSYLGIGPFVRYYINSSGDVRFFAEAGIEFASIDFGGNTDSFSNFGFNIGAGGDYFLSPNVALEAALMFNSNKDEDDDESATNIGINIGVAAFIGN